MRRISKYPHRFAYSPFSDMLRNRYPQSIRWDNIKGIIADLGDTTMPSEPMVAALQGAFFDVFQLSVPSRVIYDKFGMPKHQQIKDILLLPSTQQNFSQYPVDRDIEAIHTQFERRLCEYYTKFGVHYLPGTMCSMRVFQRRGIKLAATTGLSENIIRSIESKMPVWRPFPIVHCERPSCEGGLKILEMWNRGLPPSQRIRASQCLKIGDSKSDQDEAEALGMPFIGISQHRAKAARLKKEDIAYEFRLRGAVDTVGTLDELAELMCPWTKNM